MKARHHLLFAIFTLMALVMTSCVPQLKVRNERKALPAQFGSHAESANTADMNWSDFFNDPYLSALIDSALRNNQELNIVVQEMEIARNEVMARKGEYLPSVGIGTGGGVEKTARYTPLGANEATTDIEPGREMPDPVPDVMLGGFAQWEVDIWRKLRNAKEAAANRYLASQEGRHFLVTNLVAEIAAEYYDLLALDNQLLLVTQNIQIQSDALEVMKLQKKSGRVTELAVRRFEAQVFRTRSMQYDLTQAIIEKENRINFLVGRYPQPVARSSEGFLNMIPATVQAGLPSQMLTNRPDVKQAEYALQAAKLDVKSAKANFYPSLDIRAGLGLRAFNPAYLAKTPESLMYNLAGDLMAPLVNRKAIKAAYASANAKQMQAVLFYEQTVLNAYIEVYNQVNRIENLNQSYALRSQEVEALTRAINISNDLFQSARADYMEVLLTQRDALEARFELIETKNAQMQAMVKAYRAIGGGWK
jgi:multidrug efflux system outer membrane protein